MIKKIQFISIVLAVTFAHAQKSKFGGKARVDVASIKVEVSGSSTTAFKKGFIV